MATDGSEFKACCRLRPRATGPGPASQFVLVPSSSPLGSSTEGRIAGDAGESLPLQDGDNIVEIVERDTVGVGLDSEGGGVYERQVLLRTVNSSTMVMLKAYCDVRVRGRQQPSSSPSPRKSRASPARKTAGPLSPAGKGARAASPAKMLRTSPAKMLRASPARGRRGMSGGATRITAGAQQFFLVGDTVDLGVSGGKGSGCLFSYTLQLASSETAGAGTPGVTAPGDVKPTTAPTPPSSLMLLAAPPGSSGRGGGTDTKRRLEDIFNDTRVAGEAEGRASGCRRVYGAGEGDDGVQVLPPPVKVYEIEDDDDDDGNAVTPAVVATAAAPKHRRREEGKRFQPVGVVNLCGLDDRPVDAGNSKNQPLDLCDSDHEDNVDENRGAGAKAAAAEAKPSGDAGGGASSSSSSSSSRGRGASSTIRPLKPMPLAAELSKRTHVPSSVPPAPAALAVVKADVSWGSTTAKRDRTEVKKPKPSPSTSTCSGPAGTNMASLFFRKPAPLQRGIPPLKVSKEEKKEERRQRQDQGQDKRFPSLDLPPRSDTTPLHEDTHHPRSDVKPPHVDVARGVAAGMPTIAAGWRDVGHRPPTTTRTLTRMDDHFRCTMRHTIKDCPESSVAVFREVLARGTAPDGSLCATIVSSLLESRCSVRNGCLRRQLRAMLDVDPNIWTPPENGAPGWLDDLYAVITGREGACKGKHHDRPPSDAVLTARVAVLELVVDYVAAGRTPCRDSDGGGGGGNRAWPLFQPARDAHPAAERVMHFFECPEKKKEVGATDPTRWERANHTVETSAAWAVGAFGATEEVDGGAGSEQDRGRRRRRRRESPALVRARLLTARLLAEVVETCGLPAETACLAILAQMNSFDGGAPAGGAGVQAGPCRGLSASARGGLVRALLGRPFCAVLARVLLDDLRGTACDVVVEGGVDGVGRLEALLLRVVRREEKDAGGDVVLF